MSEIYAWLQAHLAGPDPKVIIELGAHRGEDTARLAALPGAVVHAFEPDPRNTPPALPNVIFTRAAVSQYDGKAQFYQSESCGDREWTCSGSIHEPTGHLDAYPDVWFTEHTIMVPTVALDTYARQRGLRRVDLIWADVQGAERDLIAGGRETLKHTRYLYTEYCDPPLYEGQPSLREIMLLLPGWQLLHDWPSGEAYADALLENPACA